MKNVDIKDSLNIENQMEDIHSEVPDIQLGNTISVIKVLWSIPDYTDEERNKFQEWKRNSTANVIDNPIHVAHMDTILKYLPPVGNSLNESFVLHFQLDVGGDDDLDVFLKQFASKNPSYEIAVFQKNGIIQTWIGNNTGNNMSFEGRYLGHYHPIHKLPDAISNTEPLPKAFLSGVLPSHGDLRGYIKHKETIQQGTRIYSKYGYTTISFQDNTMSAVALLERIDRLYKDAYFELFFGKNNLHCSTDEELRIFFRNELGFNIEFHYY